MSIPALPVRPFAASALVQARRLRLRHLLQAGAAVCLLALTAAPGVAAPLTPGAATPLISLSDQHGKPVRVDGGTERLLFTAERGVNDMVSKWLSTQPVGLLERQRTVYVADISAMPAVVTRMFALPKMREWPFVVGLVREPAEVHQVADVPRQPGAATVLRFADGRLTEIHLARSESQLRAALGLGP